MIPRLFLVALFALLGGGALTWSSPAATAPASASGRAKATIVAPLSLINTAPLSFGNLSAGTIGGTVIVTPGGTRTVSGGVSAQGGNVSAAGFTGTAAGLNIVIIRSPPTSVPLTRVGGGAEMRISNFVIEGGQLRVFLTGQTFAFRIGGTLQVGAAQMEGDYQGSFEVTMDYF